jgi:hypothetical protein
VAVVDQPVAPAKQIVLRFGNPNPQQQVEQRQENGDVVRVSVTHPILKQSVTRVEFWPGVEDPGFVNRTLSTDNDRMLAMIARTLADQDRRYAVALSELEQIVGVHTGGGSPDWIACDDQELERVAAAHFGCARGEPQALLTSAGRDALHAQHLGTSAQPAAFNYMALTASTTAPAASDTTLTGEITTAGGGLIRKQTTFAHTAGTNTSTLTVTFTANSSDALPVTIAQIGVFNASSAGTIAYHTALAATATLSAVGDNVTVTETVTAG